MIPLDGQGRIAVDIVKQGARYHAEQGAQGLVGDAASESAATAHDAEAAAPPRGRDLR